MERTVRFFGVIFFLGMMPIVYHLTGFVATERELGLAQLIEAMMPNRARWQPPLMRMLTYHLAFDLIYVWGWLCMGITLAAVTFTSTPAWTLILYHLSVGLALASYAIFGAVFFKTAQLSGVATTVVIVVLAIIPQVLSDQAQTTPTVMALCLIFPSSNYTYFIRSIAQWESDGLPMDLRRVTPEMPFQLSGGVMWILAVLQIIVYPLLALTLERLFHGTTSSARKVVAGTVDPAEPTVRLRDFSKT
jgi:hypothetical protein